MKKIYIKIMIVLCGIILIVFLGLFFSKNNQSLRKIKKINNLDQSYSEYVMPLNRLELMDNYKGNLSNETIYTLLYRFATETVLNFRNENIVDYNEYFEKNEKNIYINTGIDNVQEFSALISKINELPNELEFSESRIKEDSVTKKNSKVNAIFQIFYNDSEQELDVNIEVSNKEKDDCTSITFFIEE